MRSSTIISRLGKNYRVTSLEVLPSDPSFVTAWCVEIQVEGSWVEFDFDSASLELRNILDPNGPHSSDDGIDPTFVVYGQTGGGSNV